MLGLATRRDPVDLSTGSVVEDMSILFLLDSAISNWAIPDAF